MSSRIFHLWTFSIFPDIIHIVLDNIGKVMMSCSEFSRGHQNGQGTLVLREAEVPGLAQPGEELALWEPVSGLSVPTRSLFRRWMEPGFPKHCVGWRVRDAWHKLKFTHSE